MVVPSCPDGSVLSWANRALYVGRGEARLPDLIEVGVLERLLARDPLARVHLEQPVPQREGGADEGGTWTSGDGAPPPHLDMKSSSTSSIQPS